MAVKINSGDLIHSVVFKQPVSSLNEQRETERTYSPVFTLNCAKFLHSGGIVVEANSTAFNKQITFYARWMPSTQLVAKTWHLVNEGQEYLIDDIDKVTYYKQYIKLTVKVNE
jgi:hypothetical protein